MSPVFIRVMGVIEPFEFVIHTVTLLSDSNSVIVRESGGVFPWERQCIRPASLQAGQPWLQPAVRQASSAAMAKTDSNNILLVIMCLSVWGLFCIFEPFVEVFGQYRCRACFHDVAYNLWFYLEFYHCFVRPFPELVLFCFGFGKVEVRYEFLEFAEHYCIQIVVVA